MLAAALLPFLALASTALARPARLESRNDGLPNGFYRTNRCFKDSAANRLLKGASYQDYQGMTYESCIAFCFDKGWQVAGLEVASECYCGAKSDLDSGVEVDTSECFFGCTGDAANTQKCGAGDRISLLITNDVKQVSLSGFSSEVPNQPEWRFQNQCLRDSRENRAMQFALWDDNMTTSLCAATCGDRGFDLAGIEYARECYCGYAGEVNAKGIKDSNQCNMLCPGSAGDQLCGGPDALSILFKTGA